MSTYGVVACGIVILPFPHQSIFDRVLVTLLLVFLFEMPVFA
jgi:hypothetical protein